MSSGRITIRRWNDGCVGVQKFEPNVAVRFIAQKGGLYGLVKKDGCWNVEKCFA